jgi:hypothetical protein
MQVDPQHPDWMPQTVDQNGKTVGARSPPSFIAKCCFPPCAISGYETGDPTAGMLEGKALWAFILEILCCMGCVVSLCMWTPDPENIKGDGTQRTIQNKCLAGFCVGFGAIAFWESGDLCCGPDGDCTWCKEEALKGCMAHFIPPFVGLPSLDCCYVMCMWQADKGRRFFRRDLSNHGGGKDPAMVGCPVQTAPGNLAYFQVPPVAPPQQVIGQAVPAQPVMGQVVQPGGQEYGGAQYGSSFKEGNARA